LQIDAAEKLRAGARAGDLPQQPYNEGRMPAAGTSESRDPIIFLAPNRQHKHWVVNCRRHRGAAPAQTADDAVGPS
jgi:hypothetical protein